MRNLTQWFLRRFPSYRAMEARAAAADKLIRGEISIEDYVVGEHGITIRIATSLAIAWARAAITLFDEQPKARNFIEMRLRHQDGREFAFIIQNLEGKSPADLLNEAEADCVYLEKALEAFDESLRELLFICQHKCGPHDEVILADGRTNESAMIDAIAVINEFSPECSL